MPAACNATLSIADQPWLRDHCFDGRAVFPAVETLALLAAHAAQEFPAIDVRRMEDASFARFLELPAKADSIEVAIETEMTAPGRLRAALLSRMQGKTMSRLRTHGEVFFPVSGPSCEPVAEPAPALPARVITTISAEHVYRELVPFGPQYHTLCGSLLLAEDKAWGQLRAPLLSAGSATAARIGSPFPFDGALHAACVLGQQRVDYIPFPVSFARRHIVRPTLPGGVYEVFVRLTGQRADELIFDIAIFMPDGQACESASGVRMRDVSRAIAKSGQER